MSGQSIAEMAREVGVSYATMWRAVREQGMGRGESDAPVGAPRSQWQRIYRALKERIATGEYPQGERLPTRASLQTEFGANPRTVRKAIDQLADEKLIAPHGAGFVVPLPRARGKTATVLLVQRGAHFSEVLPTTARMLTMVRDLETQCRRSGLRLVTHMVYYQDFDELGVQEVLGVIRRWQQGSALIGVILLTAGLSDTTCASVIASSGKARARIAVLDESGYDQVYAQFSFSRRLFWFSMATSGREGAAVARHLWERGHRAIAYLSHASQGDARGGALAREFASLGGAIVCRVIEGTDGAADAAVERRQSNEARALGALQRTRIDPPHSKEIRLLQRWMAQAVSLQTRLSSFEDAFAGIVGNTTISALVCYNDALAEQCCDRYRLRPGLRPVHIVGFDDGDDAIVGRFTSYNFNSPAYMAAITSALLQTNRDAAQRPRGPVEIPGFITERGQSPG